VHSELVIACSLLKYHETNPRSAAASAHADYALRRSFQSAQAALAAFCQNFPVRWLGWLLRLVSLPIGSRMAAPGDDAVRELGELIMEPNPVRSALADRVYLSTAPEDAVGRLESTYQMLLKVDTTWQAFTRARSKGELDADELDAALREAAQKGIIADGDVAALAEYDARRFDCLLTDHFEKLA
jgi:acyl-CoA dehydrogenase